MSSNIIIATTKLKACELFYELCDWCGYDRDWTDRLWGDIVKDDALFDELVYYLSNHTLKDSESVYGYSLTDLYVFQMNKYNLIREIGKNPAECNKERMVLNAFRMMVDMKADPETYVKKIEEGRGEDKL
ncbi:MAG: hypothetical protein K6E49_07515 [Lachnospiraceae bacterium]|nr:hypothetical protein [Lachnospiraceae bacterium]